MRAANIVNSKSNGKRKNEFVKYMKKNYILWLLLLPGLISLILFKIAPLFGMTIAFQDYSAFKGILGSKFVGLEQFRRIIADEYMVALIKNTLILAGLTLIVTFPIPIFFALFLNEIRIKKVKNLVQSLSFLPYFISASVMVSIMYTILSPSSGIINDIIKALGGKSIYFMSEPGWFRPIYIILQIWQTLGYNMVIYIAAITGIDTALYEAASVDGANRWQMMFRISLPCISSSIITMLIISIGNIFTVDLDRLLLMYNPSVYATADVIQTYVYRIAFASTGMPQYSYGTAVNLIKSVIAFALVIFANKMAKKYSDTRVF
jgi:putative aldouronate transport system permease protein